MAHDFLHGIGFPYLLIGNQAGGQLCRAICKQIPAMEGVHIPGIIVAVFLFVNLPYLRDSYHILEICKGPVVRGHNIASIFKPGHGQMCIRDRNSRIPAFLALSRACLVSSEIPF